MTNPLLNRHELPPFAEIKPEHVIPAMDALLAENRSAIDSLLEKGDFSWEGLVAPMEELSDRLEQAWSPVRHMNAVVNTDELREVYNTCLPKLSDYYTELGQNQTLYEAYLAIRQAEDFDNLDTAQQKVITNALRDFELSGIALDEESKKTFADNRRRLSELSSQFSDHVLDATRAWNKQLAPEALPGVPASSLGLLKQQAEEQELEGCLVTLDFPSYIAVMTYCEDRALRQEVYTAYATRASDQGPNVGDFDNSAIIEEIMALRQTQATLLGYSNYAEVSVVPKMAESTANVMNFLNDLGVHATEPARAEFAELEAFARESDGLDALDAWDVPFYAERLRQQQYELSQEMLKPYFPAPTVIKGMLEVVRRLYDIEFEQAQGWQTWHPDVVCYNLLRGGEVFARFYLDLYARSGKRGGAWMDDCRVRRRLEDGGLQLPVAYLTCNFSPPVGDEPALLTHTEVVTLFHEFGHGLHHMMTRVEAAGVSGINGVAWDAVELPSQIMENWCWQRESLPLISGHFETGETLPDELLDKMLAAKNFHAALMMVRQLEFGLFDFRLHMEFDPDGSSDQVQKILNEVREQVAAVPAPASNRFQHGFGHIFAGGYAAGYYSYKWAEVLSADAFAKFLEDGIFNRQTGEQFLQTVLEQGGSKDALDLFMAFRGRKPEVEALLRQDGILH